MDWRGQTGAGRYSRGRGASIPKARAGIRQCGRVGSSLA